MKVTGPGKGSQPEAPEAPSGVAPTEPGTGAFADALEKNSAADKTGAADAGQSVSGAKTGSGGIDPAVAVSDIGAALAAGDVTPEDAVNQVIGRIVDQQLGTAAPAEMRAKVQAALRDALDVDPVLADKVKRLSR